eukprot:1717907-Lingulodinium_polyedra.AAC.1
MKAAAEEFQDAKTAAGTRATYRARLGWWLRSCRRAERQPFPLDVGSVDFAGTLLRAGGYRSAAQYLAVVRKEH